MNQHSSFPTDPSDGQVVNGFKWNAATKQWTCEGEHGGGFEYVISFNDRDGRVRLLPSDPIVATGGITNRGLGDHFGDVIYPQDYGAIGNGESNALSTRYPNLEEAQEHYPFATSMTQEIDWCAMQLAINRIASLTTVAGVAGTPGGEIRISSGMALFLGADTLTANGISLTISGADRRSSLLMTKANPMLAFGLNNEMGFGAANPSSTGAGTGYVVGDVLTVVGGTNVTRPAQFSVFAVGAGGAIQATGGLQVVDTGAYGTPPPNPASVTGGSGTGATLNLFQPLNNGGALSLLDLNFVACGPACRAVKAQFNLQTTSTFFDSILLTYQNGSTDYWIGGFDLTSVTNGRFNTIDSLNNLAFVNSDPSDAMFIIREQNNLLGHYEHTWDRVNSYAFTGGAAHYIATHSSFQGLEFRRLTSAVGSHCLRLERQGALNAFGNVKIDYLFCTQTVRAIEIDFALGVVITNSNWGIGTNRMTSLPTDVDGVWLHDCNQVMIKNCFTNTALQLYNSYTSIHMAGSSGIASIRNNFFTNAINQPNMVGVLLDATTNQITEQGNYYGSNITPVIDNRTAGNLTSLGPEVGDQPTVYALSNGETYTVPDNVSLIYFNNNLIASATIIMPAAPRRNQIVRMTFFGAITSLTVQGNTSTGQTIGGAPTTANQDTAYSWQIILDSWRRIA